MAQFRRSPCSWFANLAHLWALDRRYVTLTIFLRFTLHTSLLDKDPFPCLLHRTPPSYSLLTPSPFPVFHSTFQEILAVVILIFGSLFVVYALYMYHYRRRAVTSTDVSARYDDRWGPIVLVAILLLFFVLSAFVDLNPVVVTQSM